MAVCNNTLEEQGDDLVSKETPLWKGFTFHHFGLFLTASFGLVAVLIAAFLILQHARHYSKPWEQKHIIRILLMIPIYAVVSFLSYLFYRQAIYWEVIRDCYEAFAIASFFTLLCHYLEPTLHEQKNYFRQATIRNWIWPVSWFQKCTGGRERGMFKVPRSGLTWFNIIWIGVFQYCAIRVLFTFVSLTSQFFDRYCESSLNPAFAHIWVMVFEGSAVTIAMFCLIQFYIQLKKDLAPHRPFLKIACIKLVIFFSFWQSLVISFLSSSSGPLKPSAKLAYPDIKIGIPSMLLTIEMALFAILHVFAFPYNIYNINSPANAGDPNMRYRGFFFALADAFNPWDIVKALARGLRWVFVGYKKRELDESYNMKASRSDSTDNMGYTGPTFAGNGEAAMEYGVTKPGPANTGSDGKHDDRAGLLSHAQSNPGAAPGSKAPGLYRTDSDLEYNSSYPPSTNGRDQSPYRYDSPPRAHAHPAASSVVSGAGSTPVSVSPVAPGGAAAHPFAGIARPAYASDDDYEHVDTGYHAVSAPSTRPPPGQAPGGEWNVWNGSGAPRR